MPWRQLATRFPVVSGGVLVALFLLQATANEWLYRLTESSPTIVRDEVIEKNPELYRVLSFGQLPSTVDWLWISSLTKTDIIRMNHGRHSKFFYDVDTMTDLDPLFAEVYIASANLLAVVQNDGKGAQIILDKGEKFRKEVLPRLPESYRKDYWLHPWQVPLLLAYVHLFELNDMPSGAIYFREAAALPGAPEYLANLAQRLERPGGEYEVGLKLINFMITRNTDDPLVKASLEKKRGDLFVGQYLYELTLSFAAFRSKHSALSVLGAWDAFRKESKLSVVDPWGGTLSVAVGEGDKVVSTTPHAKVFGLE
jgi:hypothetical protein